MLTIYINYITIFTRGDMMKKTMYSLMLSKNIIDEIDRLACLKNTNRSNLINHIIAEHLSLYTPEMHIKEVFELITESMRGMNRFVIQELSSDSMLFIKSSLDYKYKPTVKYTLELHKSMDVCMGSLKIQFRTQSEILTGHLDTFFRFWIDLEKKHIHAKFDKTAISYKVNPNCFERDLMMPEGKCENEVLSEAISHYIGMYDHILKLYLRNPEMTLVELEQFYVDKLNNSVLFI